MIGRRHATRRWRGAALGLVLLTGSLRAQLAPAPPVAGQASAAPPSSSQLALAPARPPVRGRYLDATPAVIRTTAGAGASRQIMVAVDVTPKPSMRVYAPGNTGYSAVTLTIDSRSGFSSKATTYPKAEEYLFAPLNERVKVYAAPFRLTREVTVAANPTAARASAAAPGLVITGRLEYQACDDKVCYLPETLSLTWIVGN